MAFPSMPPDYPTAELQAWMIEGDAIDAVFRKHNAGQPSTEWREFVSAGNGVHYRWRALADADELLKETLPLGHPTAEHLYTEEAALFTFFSNALTCVENMCYMSYAFAGTLDVIRFKQLQRDPKIIGPGFVRTEFKRLLPNEPLTLALVALEASVAYHTIRDVRNVLSHRGSIARSYNVNVDFATPAKAHYLGGPLGDAPTWSGHVLDATFTSGLRADLLAVARPVVNAGLAYARRESSPFKT